MNIHEGELIFQYTVSAYRNMSAYKVKQSILVKHFISNHSHAEPGLSF